MRIGPFDITRVRQPSVTKRASGADLITHLVPQGQSSWWPILREGFAGAWQRGIVTPIEDAATHPIFFACLTLIANDIAKMRPMLMAEQGGVLQETANAAYSPVLRKPNHYQNRIQFQASWILSKLTRGNAYILKERDQRGVVTALYPLDPMRCRPMVTPNGDVYYAVGQDLLSGLTSTSLVVPAREIIHDMWNAIYHPLVGLSPVYAAGHAAMLGLKIIRNTSSFADNGSMIGGLLVAPGEISEQTAKTLALHFNTNYMGPQNAGKVAAIGGGLKFEEPKVMSALDAAIIDQLKWSDEKICATLHVPGYMVQVGPIPGNNNVDALGQQYFGQCLQILVESMELCLTEGLGMDDVSNPYEVELDTESLDRMDSVQRMEVATKGVVGGVYSPNEARKQFRMKPVKGGDTPYLQVQNYSLAALDRRDSTTPPPPTPDPVPIPGPTPAKPEPAKEMDEAELLEKVMRHMEAA